MPSNIVDPSSVQKQFVILNKECDNIRQTIMAKHKARLQEGQLLQTLHQTRSFITHQIRIAHETLGSKNKRKQLLKDEIQRLRNLSMTDMAYILEISETLDQLQAAERRSKRKFINQMNLINDEHDKSLRACREHDILKCITLESIRKLLHISEKEDVQNEGQRYGRKFEAQNVPTKQTNIILKSTDENSSWNQVSIELKESLQLLDGATTKINFEVNEQKRLKILVE